MKEGEGDRPRDRARTLREHERNDEPLAEGDDNNDVNDEYDEDGDIPNNSAPPAESIARSRPESQRARALTLRASYSQQAYS